MSGLDLSKVGRATEGARHRLAADTERLAASLVQPKTGTQRLQVLQAIAKAPRGLTDDEVAEATGLYRYSAAPRRDELVGEGWVRDSGSRRPTPHGRPSIVWELTAEGRIALGAEPTVTAGPVNGSGAERFSPAAPVLDGPRSVELWRCSKCGTERPGPLASGYLDERFALAPCAGCKQKRLHQRVR